MNVAQPTTAARFNLAVSWITDDTMYARMTTPRVADQGALPRAKLYPADVLQMAEAGQVVELELSQVRGFVRMFAVPELAKQRRRAIKHTKDINDTFDKYTLVPSFLPKRQQQSQQAASGHFALTLDFAAYFDQFPLNEAIRRRMCFRSGGKVWAVTRMPMGQRHAVAVAQCATNVLLSFTHPPGVSSQSCIDNVRFVGPREGVLAAAREFVSRCRQASITINELPTAEADADLARLIHQRGDWLGAEYDYAAGRQRVAEKSVKKLSASWEGRQAWTHRAYAAHMGLLFFFASVLHSPLASYFEALKQMRARSAKLTMDDGLWTLPVELGASEVEALQRWTEHALANAWTRCDSSEPVTRYLITDASGWGWGALFYNVETGETLTHAETWSEQDKLTVNTNASTSAEPEAVLRALKHFCKRNDAGKVSVLTDSSTAKHALGKGYSPSFAVNTIAAKLKASFPQLKLELHHIAGQFNPADGMSRNGALPSTAEARTAAIECINRVVVGRAVDGGVGGDAFPTLPNSPDRLDVPVTA
jgi:hypothetical protein